MGEGGNEMSVIPDDKRDRGRCHHFSIDANRICRPDNHNYREKIPNHPNLTIPYITDTKIKTNYN